MIFHRNVDFAGGNQRFAFNIPYRLMKSMVLLENAVWERTQGFYAPTEKSKVMHATSFSDLFGMVTIRCLFGRCSGHSRECIQAITNNMLKSTAGECINVFGL